MVDDTARDRAIYHALKAVDEVAAALQTHLIEEHGADPERGAPLGPSTNSLKLLRQARERPGKGARAGARARPARALPAAGRPYPVAELDRMPDDGRRYELLAAAARRRDPVA